MQSFICVLVLVTFPGIYALRLTSDPHAYDATPNLRLNPSPKVEDPDSDWISISSWASTVDYDNLDTELEVDGINEQARDYPVKRFTQEQYVDKNWRVMVSKVSADVQSKTILIIGSSLDRHLVEYSCAAAGQQLHSKPQFNQAYTCDIGTVKMGTIINYGTGEPPYWRCMFGSSAVPNSCNPHNGLRNGAHLRSKDHIKYDVTKFSNHTFGAPPSIVIVESSLWDLANWWLRAGQPQHSGVSSQKITKWCREMVPELLGWVVDSFPNSKVLFRTPPTMVYPQNGRSPDALQHMSDCIKKELDGKFDIIDFHAIVDDMVKHGDKIKDLYIDATHPGKKPTLKYLNEILNYAHEM